VGVEVDVTTETGIELFFEELSREDENLYN
jgi:hypothetical protein